MGRVACQQSVLWEGFLVVVGRTACQQGVLWGGFLEVVGLGWPVSRVSCWEVFL